MKRSPTTDRGRQTVARIVETAGELFHRVGVHATGLNEIATASGTGKGQIYHFFDDKREIVSAVIREQSARMVDAQRPALASLATADDLRAWAEQAVSVHEGSVPARCPLGALVHDVAADGVLRRELELGFATWRDVLATGLTTLQETGEAKRDRTPHDQADLLLAAYEGGLVLAAARGNTAALRLALSGALGAILSDELEGRTGIEPA